METTISSTAVRPARRRDRLLTVLAATAATLLGWVVAVPLAGVELAARGGDGAAQRVTPVAVAVSTLLAGLAGWASLALLERLTARARPVWTVVAVLVLALSLLGPVARASGRRRRSRWWPCTWWPPPCWCPGCGVPPAVDRPGPGPPRRGRAAPGSAARVSLPRPAPAAARRSPAGS